MSSFTVRQSIEAMEEYAVESVAADIIVNANESNYPLPQEIAEKITHRTARFPFNRYPPIKSENLCEVIAKELDVDIDCVKIGNGSSELLAEYARRRGSCVVVKGLRAGSDFENEFQMALINRKIYPELDTMFLTSDSQYMFLSSSIVKELGSYGADLTDFIPEAIIPDFRRRLEERSANK